MSARPGAAPSLHTNPIAFAVPASGHPLMLDMATSMVAEGKVHVALSRHLALPEGSILSADGRVSNDAGDFASGGCLLPVGGHKGFGLSAIVEALGVKLTGADAAGREPLEGGLVVCVSSGAFRPAEEVAAAVDSMRSRIRASGKTVAVLAPGDPEAQHRATAAGEVELEDELMIRLRALAATARPGKEPSA
jgi:LDH2 family malate/lactate/ureidoglycolate dehydrogenase